MKGICAAGAQREGQAIDLVYGASRNSNLRSTDYESGRNLSIDLISPDRADHVRRVRLSSMELGSNSGTKFSGGPQSEHPILPLSLSRESGSTSVLANT